MQISSIILAAGSGKRTGLKYNKVLYEINNKRVIDYSIESITKYVEFAEIILVVSKDEYAYFNAEYSSVVDKIIIGGAERQDSVYKALAKAKYDYVLIHDGARPFIPDHSIKDILDNIEQEISITLGVKVKDTIQKIDGNRVVETLDRETLITTQTPQCFQKDVLINCHNKAKEENFYGTDDTVLIEKFMGTGAFVVKGDYRNIKLTTLDDIKLLEVIL